MTAAISDPKALFFAVLDQHSPAVGPDEPDDVLQGDALPRATAAEDAQTSAARHRERQIVEHESASERFGDVAQFGSWSLVRELRPGRG